MRTGGLGEWKRKALGGLAISALAAVASAALVGCSSAPPRLASTQLTLVASTTSSNLGNTVTLTATLAAGSAGNPTGVVTFEDNGATLLPVYLTSTTATATVTSLGAGANSLTAVYNGDIHYAPVTSPAVTVNVAVPTTTTLATSASSAQQGSSVTLTATVLAPASYVPAGTITFADGATVLGTQPLATVNGAQVATITTSALPLGTDALTATYNGTGYFTASTSPPEAVAVYPAPIVTTVALTSSPSGTIASGTATTLTATITPASMGSAAPTGTVNFEVGGVSIGSAPVSNDTATLTTKQFNVGMNSLTAIYSGDTVYAGATSPAAALTMSAYTGATYTNPLNVTDPRTGNVYNCPDPSIIKAQTAGVDTWYAYCTGDAFNANDTTNGNLNVHLISIFSSPDLVNWTYVRDAFSSMPSWIIVGNELQQPSIKYFNGQYYLYYSAQAVTAAPNGSAIGVGTSATPAGPFTDSGGPVINQQIACGGGCNRDVWSPEVITDGSGQMWMAYGGVLAGLSIRKLAANGLSTDASSEVNIAIDNYYQDAFLLSYNGYFYLFATDGNNCCGGIVSNLNVHVGRSTSITGPYLDAEGNDMNASATPSTTGSPGGDPVLMMNGNDIVGPGSTSIFTDESGQMYLIYSGVSKRQPYIPTVSGYTARQLMLDALDWVNGWPVARNGAGPSDYTLPQPVPAAQPNATNGYVPPFVTPDEPGTPIASASDDFQEATLSSQWSFLHMTPTYTLTGHSYQVASSSAESTINMADLPILAEAAPAGNYMVEIKETFNVPPTGCCGYNFAQAGLFIYGSDTNYLRLDEFADYDTRQEEFVNQYGPGLAGFSPVDTASFENSTWFRLVKRTGANGAPDIYTSYSSTDGVTFLRGPSWTASLGSNPMIGLFSGNQAGWLANFDYIHVTTVTP
jgi:arabinan endo-1,5-alpha-L-arabinosidase